jgi:hypothetical protein
MNRIATGLEAASALAPGRGKIDLGAYVSPAGGGATLDVEARVARALSAYAGGKFGVASGKAEYEAQGGLRWRW